MSVLLFWLLVVVPAHAREEPFSSDQRNHWAWKAPIRPPVPVVKDRHWVRNPIDFFIAVRREAARLPAAPQASREQLLRRATFDLIGLPPTLEEIDHFVSDTSPNAWEKVVDRLLASPRYGERWGQHWLDLARFAESNGYEHDEVRPDAWRYRDYVIEAFNQDLAYDRFIREQLAGDELYPGNPTALIATGFNLLGPDMTDAADQAERRQKTLNDMTDTTGLAFLGLTLACARCHDHKFEPLLQRDYYTLQAFFTPAEFRLDLPIASRTDRAVYQEKMRAYKQRSQPVEEALHKLEAPYRNTLHDKKLARLGQDAQTAHRTPPGERTTAQKELVQKTARLLVVRPQEVLRALSKEDTARHKELEQQLGKLDVYKPAPLPVAMGLRDRDGSPSKTFLLQRGERTSPGEEVQPGFPGILVPDLKRRPAEVHSSDSSTGRRATLAEWITSRDNPLTARVLVNRLWQHHFGRGLVATASDFGLRGAKPTHPQLLDWLAVEFMENGWSIKRMHKLMLMSATYQQSSVATPEVLGKDPENHLLTRQRRIRLEGEVIRDTLLAISGRLNRKMGGPGVFPPLPTEMAQGFKGWKARSDPQEHGRRSIYIFCGRNLRFPFLEAFDAADTNLSCPKRESSTTAPQALALLNAADVLEVAESLANHLNAEKNPDERITRAYRVILGRRPSVEEGKLARQFLEESPLSELCRALFNVNEFVYPD